MTLNSPDADASLEPRGPGSLDIQVSSVYICPRTSTHKVSIGILGCCARKLQSSYSFASRLVLNRLIISFSDHGHVIRTVNKLHITNLPRSISLQHGTSTRNNNAVLGFPHRTTLEASTGSFNIFSISGNWLVSTASEAHFLRTCSSYSVRGTSVVHPSAIDHDSQKHGKNQHTYNKARL